MQMTAKSEYSMISGFLLNAILLNFSAKLKALQERDHVKKLHLYGVLLQPAIIMLFLLILTSTSAARQATLTFERITAEQGLTSNRINGIAQDRTGFLWIATNNGLNRFDGVEIRQYAKKQDDTASLSGNAILALHCDEKDELWVLTLNYLHRYNKRLDNFDRYLISARRESYRYENKGVITTGPDGQLWIGSPTDGLFMFNRKSRRSERMLHDLNSVSSLYPDREGTLWIGSADGLLIRYDPEKNSPVLYRVPPEIRRTVNDDFIWNIWPAEDKRLNLLMSSGFFLFDPHTGTFEANVSWNRKVQYDRNELRTVYIDKQNIWVGSQGGGLFVIDQGEGTTSSFQNISGNKSTLSNNSITAILKDHSGIFWIATKDGLNKYDPAIRLFPHYQNDPANPESLHYNFVSSFCECPDGLIWAGTFGKGISVFDPEKETFTPIMHQPGNEQSLVHDAVRALEPDRFGNIWIGTADGLSVYHLKNKRFRHYRRSSETGSLPSDDILSLLVSSDHRLYVGTNGKGVCFAEPDGTGEVVFKPCGSSPDPLEHEKVRKMIELTGGTIVFGTFGEGVKCLSDGVVSTRLLSDFSKSVDSDYINALCEDDRKNIWIGTWDGLFVVDTLLNLVRRFDTSNGLPSNEITGILSDLSGDIWVSGMNGLSHLEKAGNEDYKITNYSERNGLQGSYFTTYSTLRTRDGELYFGGYNGFNRFYPELVRSDGKAPIVKITDFQVFNKSVPIGEKVFGRIVLPENITEIKQITLNYRHRVIGFKFAAMTSSQVEKVKYACLLEDVDPDWITLNYNQRFISYNNLSPGDYTFHVKACNADGVWNETGTTIAMKVLPPFWKSWWAYLVYGLFIIGLLYLAREYSLANTRLEHKAAVERLQREKDAEINNLKIKFFINISHEIRTPLSLIIAPLEKMIKTGNFSSETGKYLRIMSGNANRLLNLINQLLDFRKIETGNVHLFISPNDIADFLRNVSNAFSENAALKNITIRLNSTVKKPEMWFEPDSFEKIFFNVLSNAIKFTPPGGKIEIGIQPVEDEGICESVLTDNGIGIPADKLDKIFDRFYQVEQKSFLKQESLGSGIGLSIVKNLVELHKGEIKAESTEGEYTRFILRFKLGKEHFEKNQQVTISEVPVPYAFKLHPDITESVTDEEKEDVEAVKLKSGKESRILVVEDNPEIRYYLKQSLHQKYEVSGAADGKTGYDLAVEHIPDLIITDVMMPEMDGIELCRRLKNEMLTQHIPIIMLSAKSSLEDTLAGLETGADDYVPKPFNEQLLLAKIKTLLNNRQKLIEKFQHKERADAEGTVPGMPVPDDPFLGRIISFIEENLGDETLTNEKIEMHFNISKMQLYRKLKAVSGWSAGNLIREVRIRKARELLLRPELNISEVAYRLGFSDPLYFSKYFKKEVGMSPQQYRKIKSTKMKDSTL